MAGCEGGGGRREAAWAEGMEGKKGRGWDGRTAGGMRAASARRARPRLTLPCSPKAAWPGPGPASLPPCAPPLVQQAPQRRGAGRGGRRRRRRRREQQRRRTGDADGLRSHLAAAFPAAPGREGGRGWRRRRGEKDGDSTTPHPRGAEPGPAPPLPLCKNKKRIRRCLVERDRLQSNRSRGRNGFARCCCCFKGRAVSCTGALRNCTHPKK